MNQPDKSMESKSTDREKPENKPGNSLENEKSEIAVFRPANLRELLTFIYLNPESVLLAGGVNFLRCLKQKTKDQCLPERLVDLTSVNELKKINKTMRYLDLGATLSLSRILGIRYHVVPLILHEALKSVGAPAIRNLVTLGGNVCQASPYSSIIPALAVLDAHLEIRSYTAFRWEPVINFLKSAAQYAELKKVEGGEAQPAETSAEGKTDSVTNVSGGVGSVSLHSGEKGPVNAVAKNMLLKTSLARDEIVARIRIPLFNWNVQMFKKIATGFNSQQSAVVFCGLAQLTKGVIEDFRFTFGAVNRTVYRNRNLEKPFIGRKVPLQPKDIDLLKAALVENFEPIEDQAFSAEYRKKTALKVIEWFLKSLKPF